MAVCNYQILNPASSLTAEDTARVQGAYRNILIVQWAGIKQGDTCTPFDLPDFADRAVQVAGVPGGASLSLAGTIDDVEWPTLTDMQGNPISVTAVPKIEQITELTRKIMPVVSGGNVTTNLTVTVIFRRS